MQGLPNITWTNLINAITSPYAVACFKRQQANYISFTVTHLEMSPQKPVTPAGLRISL
ncbi:hypothetical protein EMIT079MI2_270017 [Bacillus sp. IT-79MI2]